jgi:hypothetical protein
MTPASIIAIMAYLYANFVYFFEGELRLLVLLSLVFMLLPTTAKSTSETKQPRLLQPIEITAKQQKMVKELIQIFRFDLEPELATALLVGHKWNLFGAETFASNYINWKVSVVRNCIVLCKQKIDPTYQLFANDLYTHACQRLFRQLDQTLASLVLKQHKIRMRHKNTKSCDLHVDIECRPIAPSHLYFSVNVSLSGPNSRYGTTF